jgi:hypothetical protein
MFPATMFTIDPTNKTLMANADDLATVRGPSAIFEDFGDEFGLDLQLRNGAAVRFQVQERIDGPSILTFVLTSKQVGHKMIVMQRVH